jgi:predicted N-acetyltransferase YhbS
VYVEPNETDIPAEVNPMNGATSIRKQPKPPAAKRSSTDDQTVLVIYPRRRTSVRVPKGNLLLNAEFARFGPDLYLIGSHGERVLLRRYFAPKKPAVLVSEHGASLPPDLVAMLAGPAAPGIYPPQSSESADNPIGLVEVAQGDVRIRRANGLPVQASTTGVLFPGDMVTTGSDAKLVVRHRAGARTTLAGPGRLVFVDEKALGATAPFLWLVSGNLDFITTGPETGASSLMVGTPSAFIDIKRTSGHIAVDTNGTTSFDTPDRLAALNGDAKPADADNDNDHIQVNPPTGRGFRNPLRGRVKKEVALADCLTVWADQVNERSTIRTPPRQPRKTTQRTKPASSAKPLGTPVIRQSTRKDDMACAIVMSKTHAIKDFMANRRKFIGESKDALRPHPCGELKRLVADVNGTAIGFIDFDAFDAQIKFLFVDQAFREKGIGESLLRAAERAIKGRVNLSVLAFKTGILRWYRKRGYEIDAALHEEDILKGRVVWTHLSQRQTKSTRSRSTSATALPMADNAEARPAFHGANTIDFRIPPRPSTR